MKKVKLFFIRILTTVLDINNDLFIILDELSFKLFDYFMKIEIELRKDMYGEDW